MAKHNYHTVQTGPDCPLNAEGANSGEFTAVLTRTTEPQIESIVLVDESNVRNHHSDAVKRGLTYDDVELAFAQCPCKDLSSSNSVRRETCAAILRLSQKGVS